MENKEIENCGVATDGRFIIFDVGRLVMVDPSDVSMVTYQGERLHVCVSNSELNGMFHEYEISNKSGGVANISIKIKPVDFFKLFRQK